MGNITEAFVQQFADNFTHVAQQKKSRFEPCVTIDPNIVGMSKSINRLGQRTAQRRLSRHGDTPINDQNHSTRYVDLFDWEDGDMIDDQDKIRMLVDPTSEDVAAMVSSLNRAKDDVIVTAFGGSARSSAGLVALPSTQKIAVNATGLTKAKIIAAKALFRKNEADEEAGEELFMAYSSQALSDVLNDATLTSADFMAAKMLQEGSLKGSWLGFRWIPSERLPKASTSRYLYAWAKSGVKLGVGKDIVTRVGERADKGFNTQIYGKMSIGSVRIEEEKVVEIACVES